jgi:LmbE family N-acetylglucosaminyl deacetylase
MNIKTWLEYMATKRIALVCAHPDDETLAMGSQLQGITDLILIHVTNGVNRREYKKGIALARAALRERELTCALNVLGVKAQRFSLGFVDQEAIWNAVDIARRLMMLLVDVDVAVTHPYEGAHPDHDACALAVYAACTLMSKPPAHLEFASYYVRHGKVTANQFYPSSVSDLVLGLDDHARAMKRAALKEFVSQYKFIKSLDTDTERLRTPPKYNFSHPPLSDVHYDRNRNWGVSGIAWRQKARSSLTSLGIA